MTVGNRAGVLGRGPGFWAGLMLGSYGLAVGLSLSGAIEGGAAIIVMLAPTILLAPLLISASRRSDAGGVTCIGKGEAQRRYIKRVAISSSLYLVAVGLMTFTLKGENPDPALRLGVALLPGLAVIGVFWAIGRLIVEEQDEFLRMLIVRQSLVATGFALSIATIWGFLEGAEIVPHVPAFWWAVTWFLGLAIGAVFNRIQYGAWGAV